MLSRLTHFFDRLMRQYTPDPYVIAVCLTAFVVALAAAVTPHSLTDILGQWGEGFWSLITFTLQMAMVLLGGYVVATSRPVQLLLTRIARLARTPASAVALACLVGCLASWINWGLGLVVGAFFALEVAKAHPQVNFRLLIAASYSGFLVWHGGLSGSVPLLLNTKGNFSEPLMGGLIPLSQTLFSPFNLTMILTLFVALPLLNFLMAKDSSKDSTYIPPTVKSESEVATTLADRLDNSPWVTLILVGLGGGFLVLQLSRGEFALDLNRINFIFFFGGLLLHWRPKRFLDATLDGAKKSGPILVQYPLYAGIMGVMTKSGLADIISQAFVSGSNAQTFPLLAFWSAGLVNLFIPSGGGQWAVQAPIMIPAAKQLGADLPLTAMAIAWGDAWTNLIQPFWALPLLAIAQLKIRDIMGYCLLNLILGGVILSVGFLVFA